MVSWPRPVELTPRYAAGAHSHGAGDATRGSEAAGG